MTFEFTRLVKDPKLDRPIFIEGLPGIGNVGKVVADFLIDEFRAKKIFHISSDNFPHSVFVNEKNLVELPSISIYYKKREGRDLMLMTGDVQPTDEVSSYDFCNRLVKLCKEFKVKEIITLGGIGLMEIPEKPKIFCAAQDKDIIERYKKGTKLDDNLYGVVGPIIGVTGLMLALSPKEGIPSIALLAETLGHPAYLGVKGAREILKILNSKLKLKLDLKDLDEEIQRLETELLKRTKDLSNVSQSVKRNQSGREVSYIG